jgi:hypothetical protein
LSLDSVLFFHNKDGTDWEDVANSEELADSGEVVDLEPGGPEELVGSEEPEALSDWEEPEELADAEEPEILASAEEITTALNTRRLANATDSSDASWDEVLHVDAQL